MKIKLISDGTTVGTSVLNEETGEEIQNCISAKFDITVGQFGTVTLKFVKVPIQVVGELKTANKPKKKK